jgi:hypothetical protein
MALDGITIVNALDGTVQNWATKDANFSYTDSGYDVIIRNIFPEFAGQVFFTIGEMLKMANGDYQLNSGSGKEIKRFDHKPSKEEIAEAKQRFYGR